MENEKTLKTYCDVPGFSHITEQDIVKFQRLAYRIIYDGNFGDELDFDEKVSAGMLGVMNGLKSFNQSRGVTLAHWVSFNVKKNIYDETRRSCRQRRYAKDETFQEKFYNEYERQKNDDESNEDWEQREIYDEKTRAFVNEAMKSLNGVEQVYIERLYFGSCTQRELANEMNVSQSWVSRVYRRALKKMKNALLNALKLDEQSNYNLVLNALKG